MDRDAPACSVFLGSQSERLLEADARKNEPTLAQTDRGTIESWCRKQMTRSEAERGEVLTRLATRLSLRWSSASVSTGAHARSRSAPST